MSAEEKDSHSKFMSAELQDDTVTDEYYNETQVNHEKSKVLNDGTRGLAIEKGNMNAAANIKTMFEVERSTIIPDVSGTKSLEQDNSSKQNESVIRPSHLLTNEEKNAEEAEKQNVKDNKRSIDMSADSNMTFSVCATSQMSDHGYSKNPDKQPIRNDVETSVSVNETLTPKTFNSSLSCVASPSLPTAVVSSTTPLLPTTVDSRTTPCHILEVTHNSDTVSSVSSQKDSEKNDVQVDVSTKILLPNITLKVLESVHDDIEKLKAKHSLKRKKNLDFGMRKKLKNSDNLFHSSGTRSKKDYCPELTKRHIELLLKFLEDPNTYAVNPLFLTLLISSSIPYNRVHSLSNQLRRWEKLLTKRKIEGKETLCLRPSHRIVIAKEEYKTIIMEAHLGTGHFIWSKVAKDEKGRIVHNSYLQTVNLIQTNYAVGDKEFGISKYLIYEQVANCMECSYKVKELPPISRVTAPTNTSSRLKAKSDSTVVFSDPDSLNESRNLDLSDAPMTMVWGQSSPGSIWFDQRGLAGEKDHYSKLLGVINEVGLELGNTIQGCKISNNRLITKIYCAERLVSEARERLKATTMDPKSSFLADYLNLQRQYLNMGRLDLFLYDVNLIIMKYRLSNNGFFMSLINDTVKKLQEKDSSVDIKELLQSLSQKQDKRMTTSISASIQSGINKLVKVSNITKSGIPINVMPNLHSQISSSSTTSTIPTVSDHVKISNVVASKTVTHAEPVLTGSQPILPSFDGIATTNSTVSNRVKLSNAVASKTVTSTQPILTSSQLVSSSFDGTATTISTHVKITNVVANQNVTSTELISTDSNHVKISNIVATKTVTSAEPISTDSQLVSPSLEGIDTCIDDTGVVEMTSLSVTQISSPSVVDLTSRLNTIATTTSAVANIVDRKALALNSSMLSKLDTIVRKHFMQNQ